MVKTRLLTIAWTCVRVSQAMSLTKSELPQRPKRKKAVSGLRITPLENNVRMTTTERSPAT